MKRKPPGSPVGGGGPCKKVRPSVRAVDQSAHATTPGVDHPVLRRLYPQLLTLRHYLLSQLPTSSKSRRRRISQLGQATPAQDASSTHPADVQLGQLLDSALVGAFSKTSTGCEEQAAKERDQDVDLFTQQRSQGTAGGTFKPGYFLQSEIVDFVIWRLFRRLTSHKPSHLLCHGFQRSANTPRTPAMHADTASNIPGLLACHANSSVHALKRPLWCRLHALLGQGGDRIMMEMLLECSIFLPVETGSGNYYQLSGVPVSEWKAERASKPI
ncbi:uncharacterized protein K460DRAFT_113633 [Cucurbitaria berberidis CBS 394.84]|uniref:Telomerase reverse transcriptase n=1 Tax=Cucurbitaria berberidis CBS 394.84 TaxID=1168544 RepID=A0A9P4GGK9_9PLEO|nr:uncharacterized protein K460DRAFT_113633 [Cucurbitaria berberidis CBS 394.84]KAF1845713.1 hypothetical protein K460DRAFT_113633 [Cucurbitaria berberidis CBS 394.84]